MFRELLILLLLLAPACAVSFPDNASENASVCKILMYSGSSMIVYYAWQEDGQWFAARGMSSYMGITVSPMIYRGDAQGIVRLP